MTFNPEIVESQLLQLTDYLEFLKTFEKRSASEFIQNRMVHGAAERFAQLAMESIADTCTYILVRHFKGVVKGYASTVAELQKHDVLSDDLGKRLQEMMQFRNVLVHAYATLDRKRVFNYIKEVVKDGYLFIEQIAPWIEKQQKSS